MIEIQHEFLNRGNPEDNRREIDGATTYIDEKLLTSVTDPYFNPACFYAGKSVFVCSGWEFRVGVSGDVITFSYQREEICRGFFDYVLQCLKEKK